MSYTVLARRYRPQNFAELVGQESTARALVNALTQQRLHHAYLFTGTRGVGKTTIARLIAKCLNCEQGVSANPCTTCDACIAISENRFPDLIEIDAASRTKVEDTREILDNVQYTPTRGRYKIYLIDEVHMLSSSSFNALLKTLEEPPPHVVFLLATTDPEKLPATVLSRCLQFNLKRLSVPCIIDKLAHILTQENISYESDALTLIAEAADGSMRDALSLTDQAIAYCEHGLQTAPIHQMLGTLPTSHIQPLLSLIQQQETSALLACTAQWEANGIDAAHLLDALLSAWYEISLCQFVPEQTSAFSEFAGSFNREEVQLYYQITLHGKRDLANAPSPYRGLNMTLLRLLAFRPVNKGEVKPVNLPPKEQSQATPAQQVASKPVSAPMAPPPAAAATPVAPPAPIGATSPNWGDLIPQLGLQGPALALAEHCTVASWELPQITLILSSNHSPLLNPRSQQRLQEALSQQLATPIRLKIMTGQPTQATPAEQKQQGRQAEQQAASENLHTDPAVQQLMQTFSATVLPDSVKVTY